MPIGITRQADQNAFWVDQFQPHEASTSVPPVGGAPTSVEKAAAAAPEGPVTKSKKYLAPAKKLKALLNSIPDDYDSTHSAVKFFLDQNPTFAKTYIKPTKADMLKADFGPQYDKLLKHLGPEYTHQLTTHEQLPLPNSNKFNSPGGQLKNLLSALSQSKEIPTSEHAQQIQHLLDKHPTLHTYLGPQYHDALKGYLTPELHDMLQKALHPVQTINPAPTSVNPLTGLITLTPEQQTQLKDKFKGSPLPGDPSFKGPSNEVSKIKDLQKEQVSAPQGNGSPQAGTNPQQTPEHDPNEPALIKNQIAYHPDFKKWMESQGKSTLDKVTNQDLNDYKALHNQGNDVDEIKKLLEPVHKPDSGNTILDGPQDTGPHHNQYTDQSKLKKNQPKAPDQPPGLTKEILDKHWGQLSGGADPTWWTQNWLDKHETDPEGTQAYIKGLAEQGKAPSGAQVNPEAQAKWKKVYADAYGPPQEPTTGSDDDVEQIKTHQEQQQYVSLDSAKAGITPVTSLGKTLHSPEFAKWYAQYQKEGGKPLPIVPLVQQYKKQQADLEPADLGYGDEAYTDADDTELNSDNSWPQNDDSDDDAEQIKTHQEELKAQQPGDDISQVKQHQDIQQVEDIKDLVDEIGDPSGTTDEAKKASLLGEIKKVFPTAPDELNDLSLPDLQNMAHLWVKHLPSHPELKPYAAKIQAIIDGATSPEQNQDLSQVGEESSKLPTSGPANFTGLPYEQFIKDMPDWKSGYEKNLKGKTPEEQKKVLETWAGGETLLGHPIAPDVKAAAQKWLSTYFSGDTASSPHQPITLDDWNKIVPGYTMYFAEALKGKTAEEQVEVLQDYAKNEKGGTLGNAAQKALDTHFGGGGAAPSESKPLDKSVNPLAGISNQEIGLGAHSSIPSQTPDLFWKNYDTVKKNIAEGKSVPFMWQTVVDFMDKKYPQAPAAKPFDAVALTQQVAKELHMDPDTMLLGDEKWKDKTPEQFKKALETHLSIGGSNAPFFQKMLDENFPEATTAAQPAGQPLTPEQDYPPLSWVKKHYPTYTNPGGAFDTEEKIKKWWGDGQSGSSGATSGIGNDWIKDNFGDKAQHQQQAAPPAATNPPWDAEAFTKEWAKAQGMESVWPNIHNGKDGPYAKMTSAEQAKAAVEYSMAKPSMQSKKTKLQAVYDKWFGGQGAAPAPKQPYNPDTFSQEYAAILPNSGSSLGKGTATEEKAKSKLQMLIDNFPNSPETAKLKKLYEKHWADTPWGTLPAENQATSSSGIKVNNQYIPADMLAADGTLNKAAAEYLQKHWGYDPSSHSFASGWSKASWDIVQSKTTVDMGGVKDWKDFLAKGGGADQVQPSTPEPEEPPEDLIEAKPFKSEKLNPQDWKKWNTTKPQSPTDWKNFATWWGNTKLTPVQDQKLYKAVTGKDADPQKAKSWLSSLYTLQAQPSEGDIGAATTPGWASSQQYFGKDADKEWPVFSQWAQKDSGIPAGTTIKQKMAIWKNLSPADKAQAEQDYFPKEKLDTDAIVGELQKSFPDSDFEPWKKMTQGQLAKSVQQLAEGGYHPAIPVFNKYFGGNMEIPKADDKEKAPSGLLVAPPAPIKLPTKDLNEVPYWVRGVGQDPLESYAGYVNLAKAMGHEDKIKNGFNNPVRIAWQSMPWWQRNLVIHTPNLPFKDEDGFAKWRESLPRPKDEVAKIWPDGDFSSVIWSKDQYAVNQKNTLIDRIKAETDPAKKLKAQAVLQKYWGYNQPTLGETLNAIGKPPAEVKNQSWDQYLQTHTPEQVQALMKKKLKNEADPEKWIQYVAAWSKYFGTASGHKQVTNLMGKNNQGNVALDKLKQLYTWKKQGADSAMTTNKLYWLDWEQSHEQSPFLKSMHDAAKGTATNALPYLGWSPPSGAVSAGDFKMDPAVMAGPTAKQPYSVPSMADMAPDYNDLMTTFSEQHKEVPYSKADQKLIKSDVFQNWFKAVPKAYRQTYKSHPGIALEDFEAFLKGGDMSSPVPQGDGKKHVYDPGGFSPHTVKGDPNHIYFGPNNKVQYDPKQLPKDWDSYQPSYPGETVNPKSTDSARPKITFPELPNPPGQDTIPLPPGESWAPQRGGQPVHRGFSLSLDKLIPDNLPGSAKQYIEQRWKKNPGEKAYLQNLLSEIRDDVLGSSAKAGDKDMPAPLDLFTTAPEHAPDEKPYVTPPSGSFSNSFGPANATSAFELAKWIKDKNPPPEQLYELAKKWGVDKPEQYGSPALKKMLIQMGTPTFDPMPDPHTPDPEHAPKIERSMPAGLGQKILDYLHHFPYPYVTGGGLGDHLSTDEGVSTGNFSGGELPVVVSGEWYGQGENPDRPHAAWGYGSEKEINLSPGAPVKVKRVKVKLPGSHSSEWIEIPVEEQMRTAARQPVDEDREILAILAYQMEQA